MFKSRSGSQGNPTTHPPQSIEAVRRRARHRLIGASVLVLLGVLGFPLLFDTQPRPISVDIPIDIPAKNNAPALAPAPKSAPVSAKPLIAEPEVAAAPAGQVSSEESLDAREEVLKPEPSVSKSVASTAPASTPAKVVSTTVKTAPAPIKAATAPTVVPQADVKPTEAARAKALLDGKSLATPPVAAERVIVQVGAFAEVLRAREVRLKVEAAGLKTYTHVAQTPEGRRIRVRVGPFTSRAEAEKAAARIKAQGLPAAILTL